MSSHLAPARRSIRLRLYDYSQMGGYFFTICVTGHKSILGCVFGGEMQCNRAGRAVWTAWRELPLRFPSITLDSFVVMPNHVHGILLLCPAVKNTGRASPAPTNALINTYGRCDSVSRGAPLAPALDEIVGAFKSLSAAAINRALNRTGSVWQRNYYDHIIRAGKDLDAIRLYIAQNPTQWKNDHENPLARDVSAGPFGS